MMIIDGFATQGSVLFSKKKKAMHGSRLDIEVRN